MLNEDFCFMFNNTNLNGKTSKLIPSIIEYSFPFITNNIKDFNKSHLKKACMYFHLWDSTNTQCILIYAAWTTLEQYVIFFLIAKSNGMHKDKCKHRYYYFKLTNFISIN